MLGFALSLLSLRLVSVVLDGYGIFCLIMSFYVPSVGAGAFVLLSTATANFLFAVLASWLFRVALDAVSCPRAAATCSAGDSW
jgi:hypothetical protein